MGDSKGERLWRLVRSLSPSEKRAVTIASRSHGSGPKAYMVLFEALEEMPRYSRTGLARALGREVPVASVPMMQKYLYDHLLRTLRQIDPHPDPWVTVEQIMYEARLLRDRGLIDDARAHIEQAEEIARRWEFNLLLIRIRTLRPKIGMPSVHHRLDTDLFDESLELLEDERINLALQRVISIFDGSGNEDPPSLEELSSRLPGEFRLDRDEGCPTSDHFTRRVLWHTARLHYYFQTRQFKEALGEVDSVLSMYESENRQLENPENYLASLYNRLTILLKLGRDEEFREALKLARDYTRRELDRRGRGVSRRVLSEIGRFWIHEVEFHLTNREYGRIIDIAIDVEQTAQHFTGTGPSIYWSQLYHACAVAHLVQGDVKRAMIWNSRSRSTVPEDESSLSFPMECLAVLLYARIGNNRLMRAHLRRLPDLLAGTTDVDGVGPLLLEFVRALARLSGSTRSQNRFDRAVRDLRNELGEQNVDGLFGWVPWIRIGSTWPVPHDDEV